MTRTLPILACLLLGCAGTSIYDGTKTAAGADDTGGSTGAGLISVRYAIDPDLVEAMDEPARGVFYGYIYSAEEVTADGPVDWAVSLDKIEHALDLGDGTIPTELLHTSVLLEVPRVVIHGFLDSDENAPETDMGPDSSDPLTLPPDNEFDVVADTTTAVTVVFGTLDLGK